MDSKGRKVALVLSGGSLTGVVAHTAVLTVIDDLKIDIDYVIGTSAGAIAGGLYCSGLSPYYVYTVLRELDKSDIAKFSLSKFLKYGSIFSNKRLRRLLEREMRVKNSWSFLEPQFACVAVNISKGVKEILKGGCNVVDAMLASAAIPFVFEPVKIGDDYYVDGGGIANIPVSECVTAFPDAQTIIVSSLFDWDISDNVFKNKNPYAGNIFSKAFHVFQYYLKAGARDLLATESAVRSMRNVISIDLTSVKRLGLFNFDDIAITFQQAREKASSALSGGI